MSVVEWHDSRPNGKFVVVAPRAAVRRRAVAVAPVGKLVDVATLTAVAAPARSWRSSISLPLRRVPWWPRRQRCARVSSISNPSLTRGHSADRSVTLCARGRAQLVEPACSARKLGPEVLAVARPLRGASPVHAWASSSCRASLERALACSRSPRRGEAAGPHAARRWTRAGELVMSSQPGRASAYSRSPLRGEAARGPTPTRASDLVMSSKPPDARQLVR